MKKNRMMRLASTLLVAVLITTTTISGTFAKYTTSGTSTDTARVAKFGVAITATGGEEIFKETYDNGAVLSAEDVVAPGTTGTLGNFTFTENDREVAVEVVYTPEITLSGWEVDLTPEDLTDPVTPYCPLIFTVNDGTDDVDYYIGAPGIANQTELVNKVKDAIIARNTTYTTAQPIGDSLSLSWRWEFDSTVPGFKNADTQTDVKDTLLGNAGSATVAVSVTCTVNQVDDLP